MSPERTSRCPVISENSEAALEDPDYLSKQLITCIGNKRALLGYIGVAVAHVKQRLGQQRLRILDAFAGSGVVSRFFKQHASYLAANDIEDFAVAAARCYLRNRSTIDCHLLADLVGDLNCRVENATFEMGFIEELYAPRDEQHITPQDRVFYTKRNARRLDNYRRLIDLVNEEYRDLLLGPLLSEASVHANTAGVFKGFYKDRWTGIGRFGGTNGDALGRIMGEIVLEPPVLSLHECEYDVLQKDANDVARIIRDLDLAYLDPPYNEHPYGSNYFMLNLLVRYERPQHISRVSGIPSNWRRSPYNARSKALTHLVDLLDNLDAKFILISFNSEGFIEPEEMHRLLSTFGSLDVIQVPYNVFRGSRNIVKRSSRVTEYLFLVERK